MNKFAEQNPLANILGQVGPYLAAAKGSLEGSKSLNDFLYNPHTLQKDPRYLKTNLVRSLAEPLVTESSKKILTNPMASSMFDKLRKNPMLRKQLLTRTPEISGVFNDLENSVVNTRFNYKKQALIKQLNNHRSYAQHHSNTNSRKSHLLQEFAREVQRQSKIHKTPITPKTVVGAMLARGYDDVGIVTNDIQNIMGRNKLKKGLTLVHGNMNMAKLKNNVSDALSNASKASTSSKLFDNVGSKLGSLINRTSKLNIKNPLSGPRFNLSKLKRNFGFIDEMKKMQKKESSFSGLLDYGDKSLISIEGSNTSKVLRRRDMDLVQYMRDLLEDETYKNDITDKKKKNVSLTNYFINLSKNT